MGRLAVLPDVMDAIRMQQRTIVDSLQDPDISIRRRALDLLYNVCDRASVETVVGELLSYLVTADFAIREELTLKVAILSERFAASTQWYVDVILTLLDKAGDYVSDDIWQVQALPKSLAVTPPCAPLLIATLARLCGRHRLVQVVTNNAELHAFSAARCLSKLQEGGAHEVLTKVAGANLTTGHAHCSAVCFLTLHFACSILPWGVRPHAVGTRRRVFRSPASTFSCVQSDNKGSNVVVLRQGSRLALGPLTTSKVHH